MDSIKSINGLIDILKQSEAKDYVKIAKRITIPVRDFDEFNDRGVDVIVDAVLGIGVKGVVRDDALNAIQRLNQSEAPVLAIDVPSGLDADTGSVLGEAVFADATITFIGLKQGMLTHAGVDHCGEISCDSLQIPMMIFDAVLLKTYACEKFLKLPFHAVSTSKNLNEIEEYLF